jgi:cytochrome c-type biogenesis protein CcmE
VTRKRRRLYGLGLGLLGLGTATALCLTAFRSNLVFFYSPSDLLAQDVGQRTIRLGGLVQVHSVHRLADGRTVEFVVTDTAQQVAVTYQGALPDLFREGQGVVAEGHLRPDGTFVASEVLAKHDEKYMPPGVADAVKRAGGPQHVTSTLKE